MKCPKAGYLVVKIELKERSLILCCICNAPSLSVYQWTHDELSGLLEEIFDLKLAAEPIRCDIIITGDTNFSQTNWKPHSSSYLYEIPILEIFTYLNLTQHAPTQFDVMICDNPELIVSCHIDEPLIKMIKNRFSNHKPVTCFLVNNSECKLDKLKSYQYAFNRPDWDGLNESNKTQPSSPYCYTSVDESVKQWYNWLCGEIDKVVPRVTEHSRKLPPWITSPTSHLIKKLETIKKKPNQDLKRLLKLKKMEKEILKASEDLSQFETKVLKTRNISQIQNYLKCVRQTPTIPPTVRNGSEVSTNGNEKCYLFKITSSVCLANVKWNLTVPLNPEPWTNSKWIKIKSVTSWSI